VEVSYLANNLPDYELNPLSLAALLIPLAASLLAVSTTNVFLASSSASPFAG